MKYHWILNRRLLGSPDPAMTRRLHSFITQQLKYHRLIYAYNPNQRKTRGRAQNLYCRHLYLSLPRPSLLSLLPSLFWSGARSGSDAIFFSRPKAVCFWVKCHFNISPSEMFEPVYEFPKQQRNAGKVFGISGLKVAFNFGSSMQMNREIEYSSLTKVTSWKIKYWPENIEL